MWKKKMLPFWKFVLKLIDYAKAWKGKDSDVI